MIVGGADFAQAFRDFFLFISSSYVRHFCHLHESRRLTGCSGEETFFGTKGVIRLLRSFSSSSYIRLFRKDSEVFSNASFAVVVEHSTVDLLLQYLPLLTTLLPLFAISPDVRTTKFIATDAVWHDSQGEGFPFDQVLPTTTEILPFLSDFLKNRSEPRALSRLHGAPDIIASYLDQLPALGLLDPSGPDQLGVEARAE